MSSPRSVELEPSSGRVHSTQRPLSRIGANIASPLGILLILPGLVSVIGTFLTFLGAHALHGSNIEVAQERTLEQARLVASSVRDALDQAEPMLDRLSELAAQHGPERPYADFAHALLDLMKGRAGITYVSASFPDGTFQGAYLEPDGVTRFQDSRLGAEATRVRRYDYGPRGSLRLLRENTSAYDPRTRGFYQRAASEGARIWTPPYLFYESQTAGITRAAPVYTSRGGRSELHAVVTIDFDVNALSSYLQRRQLHGMRALLYASDGTVLAYADDAEAAHLVAPGDQPLRFDELDDPLLSAFFERSQRDASQGARVTSVAVGDERYFAAIAPVASEPALAWSIAYLVPERQFTRALREYEDRSLWVAAAAVLLSTSFAYLFARHITRVRREIELAKAEAQDARALAREARAEARELGSYRLVACLGRGGMGEVWRAEHRLLAREAAIKLIKGDEPTSANDSMRARFRREAQALAKLRSRNTIELFDYGVADDGTFYYVMELLDGVDLDSLVTRFGPQPASRVVHLLIQVCNSLAEAHAQGLVHRDIKPANIFLCRAAEEVDQVKVLDFGLVRAATDSDEPAAGSAPHASPPQLTNDQGMVGTPAFMSPEQARSRAVDGRADLYALGGVAFFLLTGKLVYTADSTVDLLIAHIHEPLPRLREQLPPEVPDALVALIAACLAKDPGQRPASARALRAELRRIPFAPEQAWTEARMQTWWAERRSVLSVEPSLTEPRALQVAQTVSLRHG